MITFLRIYGYIVSSMFICWLSYILYAVVISFNNTTSQNVIEILLLLVFALIRLILIVILILPTLLSGGMHYLFFDTDYSVDKMSMFLLILKLATGWLVCFLFYKYGFYLYRYRLVRQIKQKSDELFKNIFEAKMDNNNNLVVSKTEIDLSVIDLTTMVSELNNVLTTSTPIFFKGWGNQRLELDVERVRLINQYIQGVIATGQSFIKLKVDAVVSHEKIKMLAQTELNELKLKAENSELNLKLLNEEYELKITKLITTKKKLELDIETLEFEIKKNKEEHEMSLREREQTLKQQILEFEQRKKESDHKMHEDSLESENNRNISEVYRYIAKLKADSDDELSKTFISLYNKMSEELSLENITPSQVLILISLFSRNPVTSVEDVEMKRKLFEEELKKMKQDTQYRKSEVRNKRLENEIKIYKIKKEQTEIDG